VAAATQLETLYERKLALEAEKFLALRQEKQDTEERTRDALERLRQDFDDEKSTIVTTWVRRVGQKDEEIDKHKEICLFLKKKYETMLASEETDHDHEVATLRTRAGEEMNQLKMQAHSLKKDQEMLLKGLELMEKERQEYKRDQDIHRSETTSLMGQVEDLKRLVMHLKQEKREREDTLRTREKRLSDMKTKVTTLKKFKNVLHFRLKEVEESLQPKDQQIAMLKSQLQELENELERHLTAYRNSEAAMHQKNLQYQRLLAELQSSQEVIKSRDKLISQFTTDLYRMVTVTDLRDWPHNVKQLYQRYVRMENVTKPDTQSLEELDRQVKLMEKKIKMMGTKGARAELACKLDIQKKSQENSALIVELNELRQEKVRLQQEVKSLNLHIRSLEGPPSQQRLPSAAKLPPSPSSPALGIREPSLPPAATRETPAAAVGKRMIPGTGGLKKGSPTASHMTLEERQRMQNLLVQADLNQQQIQLQKLEIRILRDQLAKLMSSIPEIEELAAPQAHTRSHPRPDSPSPTTQIESDFRASPSSPTPQPGAAAAIAKRATFVPVTRPASETPNPLQEGRVPSRGRDGGRRLNTSQSEMAVSQTRQR